MTKELLAAKTTEVQECEYQWAVAKARVAQCESEKMSINADKEILQVVGAVLKAKVCKNGRCVRAVVGGSSSGLPSSTDGVC